MKLLFSKGLIKFVPAAGLSMLLFLTLTYPVVSYSIDSYTNFPASEESALQFIADEALTEKKTIYDGFGEQLLLYNNNFIQQNRPGENSSEWAEIIPIRNTSYYYRAMRHELSFSDNLNTRLRNGLYGSTDFNNPYQSLTVELFIREA
jgi:hypothetical protein